MHIYRRPFDYAQRLPQQLVWFYRNALNAQAGSAAFTAYAASITSGGVATENPSRSVRFVQRGFFRQRWNYAEQAARINVIYTDLTEIQASAASGTFATYAATVQLGSSSGATVTAGVAAGTFATYAATVQGGRQDPIGDSTATFQTYPATITATAGLGVSRTGTVSGRGSGGYTPGTVSGTLRGKSRIRSVTKELVRSK